MYNRVKITQRQNYHFDCVLDGFYYYRLITNGRVCIFDSPIIFSDSLLYYVASFDDLLFLSLNSLELRKLVHRYYYC